MREGTAVCVGKRQGTENARRCILALTLVAGVALSPATPTAGWINAQETDADLSGLTATIARSESGVHLRAEPGFGSEVVATLPDGTVIELRIDVADTVLDQDGETRWWPVRADGVEGWVAGYYLDQGGTAPETPGTDEPAAEESDDAEPLDPGGSITGATSTASITSEDGANFRAEPGTKGEVLAILPFATVVELRIDEADTVVKGGVRWWPVRYNGAEGWLAGDYLADTDGVVVDDAVPVVVERTIANLFGPGEYVAAATDDGSGLNIRVEAGADNERVGFVREGDVVQVMDGPFATANSVSGWYLVTDGAVTGYVDGDFLTQASQPPAPAEDADPVVEQPALDPMFFAAGDFAAVGNRGVNVRSGASLAAGVLKTLNAGDAVEVLSGPTYDDDGAGWYLVTDGVTTGYANGNFLVASAAPAPVPDPPPAAPAVPVAAAGVATGSFIIPVERYVFTQAYGCSPFVFEPYDANLGCNFHNGIDLANVAYTPLLAADGGVVKYAGWCDCGLGFFVEIDHGNGFSTVYGHMAEQPWVVAGQAVAQGEVIGPMGSTGLSTGSHVHFMIKLNGGTVDPLLYLPPV